MIVAIRTINLPDKTADYGVTLQPTCLLTSDCGLEFGQY